MPAAPLRAAVSLAELERDRRLVPRLYVRLLAAGASLLSAVALALGREVPVLLDADPELPLTVSWVLAAMHLATGVALLADRWRRGAAGGLGALLLGWMAFLGYQQRYPEAVGTAVLLMLTLQAASPVDEGPWKPRSRRWPADLSWALRIAGVGFFGLFVLGGPAVLALTLVGGWMHAGIVRRMGAPRPLAYVLLLWVLVFWVGVGGVWSFVGHTVRADYVASFIGWAPGSPFQSELAAYHLSLAVLGFLCFWMRDRLWLGTVLGKAIFLYGAAVVHVVDWMRTGNANPGNVGLNVLVLGDVLVPTVMIGLAIVVTFRPTDGSASDLGAGEPGF